MRLSFKLPAAASFRATVFWVSMNGPHWGHYHIALCYIWIGCAGCSTKATLLNVDKIWWRYGLNNWVQFPLMRLLTQFKRHVNMADMSRMLFHSLLRPPSDKVILQLLVKIWKPTWPFVCPPCVCVCVGMWEFSVAFSQPNGAVNNVQPFIAFVVLFDRVMSIYFPSFVELLP